MKNPSVKVVFYFRLLKKMFISKTKKILKSNLHFHCTHIKQPELLGGGGCLPDKLSTGQPLSQAYSSPFNLFLEDWIVTLVVTMI